MNLGARFAETLASILHSNKHRFARLDLHKNLLQDEGVKALMHEVHKSKSIVELNLASNEISNEGMIAIFQGLVGNESIVSLNISTIEGVARNRISVSGVAELRNMLRFNNFLELVDLSSIGLGNAGLDAICDALLGSTIKKQLLSQSNSGFTNNGGASGSRVQSGKQQQQNGVMGLGEDIDDR